MGTNPAVLRTPHDGQVSNFRDWHIQLGRRFRALKLWMVIRAFGTDGLAERLREHCALARELAGWIESTDDWQLMAPVPFALVCFRYAPPGASDAECDRLTERIMHAVNDEGEVFLSHTKLNDRFTLRMSIGNIRTERKHVALAWQKLNEAAASAK
jgi:aromatic-L-amino-acid decarboxylase